MATPRFAWGIDIGNRALKAIRLSPGPEGLVIDDFDVVEHEQVLSNAGDNRESLITSALASFVQRHDLKGAPVAIGVSGQSSFARFIKLPPVEPKKIPEIVRFEAIQQIPFPLDEVEWSYQLFQDEQSPDVEVGIFAMRKELVNQHITIFTDMGVNVQVVQMNPLAVYNAMYYDQRLKGTTMLIDLGAENTDLIIAEGETIWLRSIPIGGNNFTESLVKAFKLKFPKAEELKRNAATSKYGRQILQAMKPVFNDLVSEIQRSIGFYASTHRDARIARVLALGGTFRLPGLQKYVQQNLQVEVHRIDRLGTGAPAEARVATAFNENILSAPSAYGLAIQALGHAKINSSLLPMKIRREKVWQEKTKWFAAAAAVFVAAPLVGLASIYWANRTMEANRPVDQANEQFVSTVSDYDTKWDGVENGGAPDRARVQNYESLLQGRQLSPVLIDDITAVLPPTPSQLLTNDKSKLPPRDQRQIIRIDRIVMDYHADMAPILAMNDQQFGELQIQGASEQPGTTAAPGTTGRGGRGGYFGGRGGRGMAMPAPQPTPEEGAAAGPKQRGFVIEVVCTTPNADGASFVVRNFSPKLQSMKSSAPTQVNYAVKKVYIPSKMKLGDDPNLQAEIQAATAGAMDLTGGGGGLVGGGGGFTGRGGRLGYGRGRGNFNPVPNPIAPATTGPADQAQFNPLEDPATHEDMSNDTRVVVRMAVILDPQADQAAGSTPQVAQSNP